ncbi:jerky protein-like [Aphis craccivora]|uniref:Jerky protein-like n=1 Tax=Aphis craccivora TaxID=307492 RepID=A0A6G0VYM5_APHCR|nr:jerky protein-like [Aphis craccivora]
MLNRERYIRNDIYNADETGIKWKELPRKLLASRREPSKLESYKVSTDKITAMVCSNARGDHAFTILVIGKAIKH